jgi:hypothetical protein
MLCTDKILYFVNINIVIYIYIYIYVTAFLPTSPSFANSSYANPSPSMQTRWLNVINKVVGKSGDRVCQLVCPLKYKWLVYGTYDNSWLYLIINVLLNVCFICSIKFVHTPRRLLYEFTTCRLIVGKYVDGFVNSARLANTAWQYGTEFAYSLTVLHTG